MDQFNGGGSFGPHALDAANLADAKQVLVSVDMYFRQYGEAACSTKGAWLQVVFSFALDLGIVNHRRYVDLVVGLAWRRHGHLALNADVMLTAIREDQARDFGNFAALANFMGTRNAELRSHINVCVEFLNQLWLEHGEFDLACKRATSILIERMVRFRSKDWALVLAFIKRGCAPSIRQFLDGWLAGHCLSDDAVTAAGAEIEVVATQLRERRSARIVAGEPKTPRERVRRRRKRRR